MWRSKNYFRLVQKIQESIVNSLIHRVLSKFPIIILYIFFAFLIFVPFMFKDGKIMEAIGTAAYI